MSWADPITDAAARAAEMAAAAAQSAVGREAIDGVVRARLRVLFRHSIREGLVNPLLHLVPPYRLAEPAEGA